MEQEHNPNYAKEDLENIQPSFYRGSARFDAPSALAGLVHASALFSLINSGKVEGPVQFLVSQLLLLPVSYAAYRISRYFNL